MSTAQQTTILEKIRSRGYWRVIVRPTKFVEHHVPYLELYSTVERCSVRLRGWDYPHIDQKQEPQQGRDWVGQEHDWNHYVEAWRMYQSGQFVHLCGLQEDWRDQSRLSPAVPGWRPLAELRYRGTVFRLLEIFEFAARMAQSPAGAPGMRVEIALNGLAGRSLDTSDFGGKPLEEFHTRCPDWKHVWEGPQIEMMAEPRRLAASAARDLLDRFGLSISLDMLTRVQETVRR